MDYPAPLGRLIDELRRLPGIGPKSAQRVAFFLLRSASDDNRRLGEALATIRDEVGTCETCFAFSDTPVCHICQDASRNDSIFCVVEEPQDLLAVERTRDFRGRYHVLHGSLSPVQGVGPDELKIAALEKRLRESGGKVEEVIVATSPTVEGEATAAYLAEVLKPTGVKLTRIAMGLPVGSDLDWADEVTLAKALEGRREY